MPQVPEQSIVPTVQPSGAAPEIGVSTPLEAFGGGVAHALGQLGGAVETAGDRIWQRAEQLQDMKNRAETDDGVTEFMKQAGLEHAKFSAMEGQNAAAYYPTYIQNLENIRKNIRGKMTNPTTQRMYDSESLSTLGRTIFNGAGHAATQTHIAAVESIDRQIAAKIDTASTSKDPAEIAAARRDLSDLNIRKHAIKGTPDYDSVAQDEKTINSSLTYHQLKHEGATDPWSASEKFDKARSGMTQHDADALEDFLIGKKHAIGAVNIASEVLNANKDADGKPIKSYDQLEQEVRERSRQKAPGDDVMEKNAVQAFEGQWRQKKYGDRQFKYENTEAINDKIVQGVSNLQELLSDPKASAAYFNLDNAEKLRVVGRINRYNAARDQETQQRAETTLAGMRLNKHDDFMSVDPTDPKWQLSQPQMAKVYGWQRSDRAKRPDADIGTAKAMGWMRDKFASEMQALDVYRRNAKDPDDYDHLTGMMYEALDLWRQNHNGKQPGPQDVVKDIAPTLLQTHSQPKWFGLSSKDVGAFVQDVPQEFIDDYKAKVNPRARDTEIYQSYLRKVLIDNYQKATQGAGTTPKSQ